LENPNACANFSLYFQILKVFQTKIPCICALLRSTFVILKVSESLKLQTIFKYQKEFENKMKAEFEKEREEKSSLFGQQPNSFPLFPLCAAHQAAQLGPDSNPPSPASFPGFFFAK
jgi:hypothetical protein